MVVACVYTPYKHDFSFNTRRCSWNTDLAFTIYSLTTAIEGFKPRHCLYNNVKGAIVYHVTPPHGEKMAAIPDDCEITACDSSAGNSRQFRVHFRRGRDHCRIRRVLDCV